jgi:hypothetical protein
MFFTPHYAEAAQWSAESKVDSYIEYNDNIFLTSQAHESVSGLVVTPSLKMFAQEKNWETFLNTRLRSNNYSDSNIDSNDIYFDLTGKYSTERNSYSINGTLDLDSNLNSESTDFGITGQRVKRELRSITPQFSRMITERLSFSTSYSHADVDYVDANNTGFVPYNTDTVNGSLVYNLSEKDQVNFMLQATDYKSKDDSFVYDLVIARFGMNHKLNESFSYNYLLGASQRDSTSRSTQTFNFFGQPVTLTQVNDFSNSGLVLDAGFEQEWLASSLTGSLSRDNTTDSFGGLNQVDKITLIFTQKTTPVWSYSVNTRYENVKSIDSSSQFANREVIVLKPTTRYSLDKDWSVNASYRYTRRKFESQASGQAPDSNRILIGITYNFPSMSTF